MSRLARHLVDARVAVETPLLPGHGTSPEDLNKTTFTDWYLAAEKAYLALEERVDAAFICGHSMGGTLALQLAQEHEPAGIVTSSAPVFLYSFHPWRMRDWRLPFAGIIKHFKPMVSLTPPRTQTTNLAPWEGYRERMAVLALHSLIKGMGSVRSGLGRITCPVLVWHSPKDSTVHTDNAWEILAGVSSMSRRLELFPLREHVTSHHMLVTHMETRDVLGRRLMEFIESTTEPGD
jgi:carboxylesterase